MSRLRGKKAEDLACCYLQQQGLTLVTRNYHCRHGELDLIMLDDDIVVFVEVRLRNNQRYGSALESIDAHKRRKLIFTANHYLQQETQLPATRFDVITLNDDNTLEWFYDAFSAD